MNRDLAVLVTDNLHDYALAAGNAAALAERGGFARCWPVIHSADRSWGTEPLRSLYGVVEVPLGKLLGSLDQERPILLASSAPPDWESCEAQPLAVARRGSLASLPAALYAAQAGKRFVQVDRLDRIEGPLSRHPPASLILADDLPAFGKPSLERLLAWSLGAAAAPIPFGVLTGRSLAQLSSVVCRLLLHRELHARGHHLRQPAGLEPIPVGEMEPMEYYVIGAHGNEMHLRHRRGEVLCGASRERRVAAGDFDCESRCRFEGRVRSDAIPAHVVFLLSCDAFTLGDGLVPPDFNVMLTLLDGWTAAVLAPTKHVLGSHGTVMLAESLVADGYSLGEVAQRLNEVCRYGTPPDPAYLVLGDPDLVVRPQSRRPPPGCAWKPVEGGIEIVAAGPPRRVIELTVPEAAVAEALREETPAVLPLTDELLQADVCLSLRSSRGEMGVTLFSPRELTGAPWRLRIERFHGLGEPERQEALERLDRLSFLAASGILQGEDLAWAREEILFLLRSVAGYPRAVELALVAALARHLPTALDVRCEGIRRRVLAALLAGMESTNLWISQRYARVYARIERTSAASDGPCPFCGNSTVRWLHEDPLTGLPARHLVICSRCGISADVPAASELEICLEPRQALPTGGERLLYVVRNRSERPLRLSCVLCFNQWKDLGLRIDPESQEIFLGPGDEAERTVELSVLGALPDDTLHLQFFALTDRLDLYFVGQKVISRLPATA